MRGDVEPAHGVRTPARSGAARTEQAILDAAARLLAANRGASMSEIAAAAGVGRTTLHRYFATREALIRAIAQTAISESVAAVERSRSTQGPAVVALERLVEALVPLGERFHFLLTEAQLGQDPVILAAAADITGPIHELLQRAGRDGTLRPDVPTAWATRALEALLYAAWQGVHDGEIAPRQTPRLVLTTLLSGLGAPDGGGDR